MAGKDNHVDKLVMWLNTFANWIGRTQDLRVVYAGLHHSQSNTPAAPYIGICYQAIGEYEEVRHHGQPFRLPNGHLSFGNSHQGGICTSVPQQKVGLWVMTLLTGTAPEFEALARDPVFFVIPVRRPTRLIECYEAFMDRILNPSSSKLLRVKAAALEIVAAALDEVNEGKTGLPTPPAIEKAERFMCQRYADPHLVVGDAAAAAHVSIRHLDRLFCAFRGHSPSQALRLIRIAQAKRLLETTGMRISEVGWEVGFNDAQHFSRVFRKITGISPVGYCSRFRAECTKAGTLPSGSVSGHLGASRIIVDTI